MLGAEIVSGLLVTEAVGEGDAETLEDGVAVTEGLELGDVRLRLPLSV